MNGLPYLIRVSASISEIIFFKATTSEVSGSSCRLSIIFSLIFSSEGPLPMIFRKIMEAEALSVIFPDAARLASLKQSVRTFILLSVFPTLGFVWYALLLIWRGKRFWKTSLK